MVTLNLVRTFAAGAIMTMLAIQPLAAQGLGGSGGSETADPVPKTETPAPEIDRSLLPSMSIYQAMLDANKKTGWIAFRNYNGKQWVYFTILQSMHCRLKEIRYSINSTDLDQRFNLVKCNPYTPFALPNNVGPKDTLIKLPLGEAQTVAVQVVWEDDRESEIVVYRPCPDVGENTCATVVE